MLDVEFVGFRLSAQGISPLQSNIKVIHRILEPTSAFHIASFLGMMVHYLRFLPRYSTTMAPLCQLLRKDEPCVLALACVEAICVLKSQLAMSPILAHFNQDSPTLVY